jgi:hypothetical protein
MHTQHWGLFVLIREDARAMRLSLVFFFGVWQDGELAQCA